MVIQRLVGIELGTARPVQGSVCEILDRVLVKAPAHGS